MRAISFQAGFEEADEAPGDGLDLLRGEGGGGKADGGTGGNRP